MRLPPCWTAALRCADPMDAAAHARAATLAQEALGRACAYRDEGYARAARMALGAARCYARTARDSYGRVVAGMRAPRRAA